MTDLEASALVLDASMPEYVSPKDHTRHAAYCFMMGRWHKSKGLAAEARLKGLIQAALGYEAECDEIAARIEKFEEKHGKV